jgi:hypothetical protein
MKTPVSIRTDRTKRISVTDETNCHDFKTGEQNCILIEEKDTYQEM